MSPEYQTATMISWKRLFFLIRASVSGFLIYYLLSIINLKRLHIILTGMNANILFLPPILMLAAYIFAALRWKILLQKFRIYRQFGKLYIYYLSGAFYGMILPGVVGGDFVRAALCRQAGKDSLAFIATSVLVERIFGVFILFVISFFVVTVLSSFIPDDIHFPFIQQFPYMFSVCIIIMVLTVFLSHGYLKKKDTSSFERKWLKKLVEIFFVLVQMRFKEFILLLFLSGTFQVLTIFADYSVALALNISLPLPFFFLAAAFVFLATLLPVSIGGLGVREGVFVFLLTNAGVPSSDSITLSFLIYCNRILASSFGGIIQPFAIKTNFEGQK